MRFTCALLWALLSIAVSGGCSKDPDVAKREYLETGDQYVAQGKLPEAVVQYKNAIQQDPRFGEGRLKLADAYAKQGDAANAFREYVRAADVLPDDVTAQIKAAGVLLLARRYEDAQARADKALEKDPENVEALLLRAHALVGLKKPEDALNDVEEAIRSDPARANSYAALGVMFVINAERDKAEAAFKRAIEIGPTSIEARLALAQFYWASGLPERAEPQFKAALGLNSRHELANRTLAYFYLSSNRVAEAEPHFKVLAEVHPHGAGKLMLAEYYIATRRGPEASAILEELAQPDSEAFVPAKVRLSTLARSRRDFVQAERLLEDVLAREPGNVAALVSQATLLGEQGRLNDALQAARKATETDPESASAQLWLGKIQRARGESAEATKALTQALQFNPHLASADLELALLNLAARRFDEAERFARSGLKKAPGSADAKLMVARIAVVKGDLAAAEPLLKKLAAEFPTTPGVLREVGRLQVSKKNFPAARAALEKGMVADPQDTEALGLLIGMDVNAGRSDMAKARLDAALQNNPRDSRMLVLGARVYASLRDYGKTEELLRRSIEVDPARTQAYEMLGQMYVALGRGEQALKEFEALAQRNPKSVGAHVSIGTILQTQNRRTEAKDAYRRALALDATDPMSANNLAWMYAEDNEKLDEALALAQAAKVRVPESHEISDTLGWIYFKKGLAASAVPFFKEAADKDPNNAGYQYHLGLASAKNGDVAGARKALETALKLNPNASEAEEARSVLAQLGLVAR